MNSNGQPISSTVAGDFEVEDDVTIGQDLTITGNLTVNGVTTTIDTETLQVEDPLILTGLGNQANSNDGGLIMEYNAGSSVRYSGIVRDKNSLSLSNQWKVVDGLTSQPNTSADNRILYNNNLGNLKGAVLTGESKIVSSGGRFERSNGKGFDVFNDGLITTDNDLRVNSKIDCVNNTPLAIGDNRATQVDISKSGSNTNIKGNLKIEQDLDRETAGHLDIGGSMATVVNLGKSGVQTQVRGQLYIQSRIDCISPTSNLLLGGLSSSSVSIAKSGTTSFIKGPLNVQQIIDRETAGTLQIAPTTSSKVEISKLGDTTQIKGSLKVDQKLTALNFGDDGNRNLFIGEINDPSPTGTDNISIGLNTGDALTTGQNNVFIGNDAGSSVDAGRDSVYIGRFSGARAKGNFNTGLGAFTVGNTNQDNSGINNVAIGSGALQKITTGNANTIIGSDAGNNLDSGSYNITIGKGNVLESLANTSYNLRVGVYDGVQKNVITGNINTGTLDLGRANGTSIVKTLGTTNSTSNITGSCQVTGGLGVAASIYANNLFNNHVAVYKDGSNVVQGLPTPSAGFHLLEDNKNYVVYGQITLTNGIQFGANCSIRGDGFSSTITFNESSANIVGFKSINQNVYVSQLTITGGGGHFSGDNNVFLFDCSNYTFASGEPFYGRNRRFKVTNCNILGARQIGKVVGFGTLNISNNFFNGLGATAGPNYTINGWEVTSGLSLEFNNNKVVLFFGATSPATPATGYMLQFKNVTDTPVDPADPPIGFNAVNVSSNIFHPRDQERGILFDTNSTTQLGLISSNTFIRTDGSGPLIDYRNDFGGLLTSDFENYNITAVKTYLVDNNTGVDNSEAELECTMTESAEITSTSPIEIDFLNNAQMGAITRTKRWGVQMNMSGIFGGAGFQVGQRIMDSSFGTNTAYIIAVDTYDPVTVTQRIYLCDFVGGFGSGGILYAAVDSGVSATGGVLKPRFRYCGNAPRQLTLTSTWNCTSGNNSEVKIFPGDGNNPDLGCETVTITSASGVGSSLAVTCSRRYEDGNILNFYAQRSAGTTKINKAVICVH